MQICHPLRFNCGVSTLKLEFYFWNVSVVKCMPLWYNILFMLLSWDFWHLFCETCVSSASNGNGKTQEARGREAVFAGPHLLAGSMLPWRQSLPWHWCLLPVSKPIFLFPLFLPLLSFLISSHSHGDFRNYPQVVLRSLRPRFCSHIVPSEFLKMQHWLPAISAQNSESLELASKSQALRTSTSTMVLVMLPKRQ